MDILKTLSAITLLFNIVAFAITDKPSYGIWAIVGYQVFNNLN